MRAYTQRYELYLIVCSSRKKLTIIAKFSLLVPKMRVFSQQIRWIARLTSILCLVLLVQAQFDLGLQRDPSTSYPGSSRVPIVFTSVVEFAPGQTFSGPEVAWFATLGHSQMTSRLAYDGRLDLTPAVMAALAVDNKVYLASSMKGSGMRDQSFFVYFTTQYPAEATELRTAIANCQLRSSFNYHRRDGSCGEPMALSMFYKDTSGAQQLKNRRPQALMAAYDGVARSMIVNPCSQGGQGYTCTNLLTQLGIKWIPEGTNAYPPDSTPVRTYQVCLGT